MNKLFKFVFVNIFVFFLISFSKIYAVDIQSPAAVVICEESGRILYDKNCNEQRKMASLTKLMTSILLVENCDLDEKITVEKQACYIGGSEAGISPNDEVTAKDLLYGMLLPSGNDCALAVAYHVGGNIENFAMLMNEKAKELGLTKTSFANPHGLDNDSHYTTAYEMALITRYARKYDIIKKVASTTETNVTFGNKSVNLRNTNRLLRTYPKATGMKTGFTNGANRCLAASASYNNLNLIAVVLGSDTSDIRFNDAKAILEDSINALNIPKSEDAKEKNYQLWDKKYAEVPNVVNQKLSDVKGSLQKFDVQYTGSGEYILFQSPSAGERVYEGSKIRILLGDKK